MTDLDLIAAFECTKVIALVGWSPKQERPSNGVARYLTAQGFRVIPVNPGVAGKVVSGETVRASLSEIDEPVDMVDIFRKSGDVPQIVAEALEYLPMVKTIWMQLGVMNSVAAQTAREKGLFVVENSCLAIELPRLRSAGHRV